MEIKTWVNNIVNGPTGFKVQEDREYIVYHDREIGVAEFVIRCLANPACDGSQQIIDSIIERRAELGCAAFGLSAVSRNPPPPVTCLESRQRH